MFYAFSYKVTAGDLVGAKYKMNMPMAVGVLHQVDVLFQAGCAHLVHVQIWQDNVQLWPSNRGENIRGNATAISFRDFFELKKGSSSMEAYIWQDGGADGFEIIIQLGVLPKSVLQPLSFEELLKAATGVK